MIDKAVKTALIEAFIWKHHKGGTILYNHQGSSRDLSVGRSDFSLQLNEGDREKL